VKSLDSTVFSLEPPRLVLWRCEGCDALHFPRRAVCATCGCERLAESLGGAAGELYTFTVVHAAPPGYEGPVPYGLGVVEVDDGLRVEANLHASDLSKLRVGQRVVAATVPLGGEGEDVTGIVSYHPEGGA
jgi:uncharacterized OB-fold protein